MNWLRVVWMSFQVNKNNTFLWLNLFCVPAHGRRFSVHSHDSPLRIDATTHPPQQEVSRVSLLFLLPPFALPLETPLPLSSGRAPAMESPDPVHSGLDASLDQGAPPRQPPPSPPRPKVACLSGPLLPAPEEAGPTLCPFRMRCAFLSPRLLSSHCDFLPLITPSWAVPLLQLLTLFQFQSIPIILPRYYLTEVMLG